EILVLNPFEQQIDARHQERIGIPSRRAVYLQRDAAAGLRLRQRGRRGLADRDHLATGVDDEVRLMRGVDNAAHRRQAVQAERQLEVLGLFRQVLAEGEL